jgi:hypothetical protein
VDGTTPPSNEGPPGRARGRLRPVTAALIVLAAVLGLAYLGLRLWAHSFLNARRQKAVEFAREHGIPVVAAINQYYEKNGQWPKWIHEDLVPEYLNEVHAGWAFWDHPTPHLSTRIFPFDDVFLTWDFKEKCWRLGSERLQVEP